LPDDLKRFWPDREALLYDALRYLSQQVDAWRRQLLLDETLSAERDAVGDHFQRGVGDTLDFENLYGFTQDIFTLHGSLLHFTLEMVADRVAYPLDDLKRFWPDREALLYDALRYLSR
jgi:AcrR family transcriptional regulator